MRIAILGATGNVGRSLVEAALAAGHSVSALERRAGTIQQHARVTATAGTLADEDALAKVLDGADAVISVVGPAFSMGSRKPVTFMQENLPKMIAAAEVAGVRRFVHTSAFGVGATARKASGPARLVYRLATAPLFEDKRLSDLSLERSRLNWSIAYPVNLKDAPATRQTVVKPLEQVRSVPGMPTLPFINAAHGLLDITTDDTTIGQHLLITTERGWRPWA